MIERASLESCCKAWSLTKPKLLSESILADVYHVQLPSGKAAALKLFTLDGIEDEWEGAQLLQWYAGKCAVNVIAQNYGALLMEWLDGGNLMALCDNGRAEEAAMIAARLANCVRNQTAPHPQLKTIEQRFEFLFSFQETRIAAEYSSTFRQAMEVAKDMLRDVQYVPLHGDVHFENVLFDGKDWRLIDPKGLMGPPAYDLANLFINPWDQPEIVLAAGRMTSLASRLSMVTGFSMKELLGWAIAHAAISATWCISSGNAGRHPLNALGPLLEALAQVD